MKTFQKKIVRTMLYLAISMLILAGGVLTALAATGELQTTQDLFTPAITGQSGSLAGSNCPTLR